MFLSSDTYVNKENKIKSIIILLIFNIFITCSNENSLKQYNNESKTIGITRIEKATMRVDPFINSSVITYINKGEIVIIYNKSPEKEKIGKYENYWYNVRFSRGYVGWIYGNSLKLFSSNNTRGIENYLSELWEKELKAFQKKIAGKWGLPLKEGTIPEKSLDIFDNGKYKSYLIGSKAIEGEYNINIKEKEVNFSNGTFFGNNISFMTNGNKIILVKGNKERELKLKKLSLTFSNSNEESKITNSGKHGK